jgi:hypothetical protein
MSEQGIDDYGLAKRKAAERFGATDIAVLPRNTEIEAAPGRASPFVRSAHSLDDAQLAAQDGIAGDAPAAAIRAAPRRAGAQRHGVSSFGSEPASVRGRRRTGRAAPDGERHSSQDGRAALAVRAEPARCVSVVHFVAGDRPIDAVVFPIDGIRQSPASPVDGRPMKRADTAEIEAMLEAESG